MTTTADRRRLPVLLTTSPAWHVMGPATGAAEPKTVEISHVYLFCAQASQPEHKAIRVHCMLPAVCVLPTAATYDNAQAIKAVQCQAVCAEVSTMGCYCNPPEEGGVQAFSAIQAATEGLLGTTSCCSA